MICDASLKEFSIFTFNFTRYITSESNEMCVGLISSRRSESAINEPERKLEKKKCTGR